MRPDRLPLIAAGDGTVPPQRWTGPFVHVSDLTPEELADWIPPVDDDAAQARRV